MHASTPAASWQAIGGRRLNMRGEERVGGGDVVRGEDVVRVVDGVEKGALFRIKYLLPS